MLDFASHWLMIKFGIGLCMPDRIPATCGNCGRGELHLNPRDKHLWGFLCYESAAILAVFIVIIFIIVILAVIT